MNILLKNSSIVAIGENISFGIFDEPFEKWCIADSDNNVMYYMIDDGFILVSDLTLPDDFEQGKYFYKDGAFVFNEDWKPYYSVEEQLDMLQKENDDRIECEAEILYELSLLQLGLI